MTTSEERKLRRMPRQPTQEAFTTFIGGLNTEAGELTFPKNASVDELNCLLDRDGSRRRRLSVNYEDDYVLSSETYGATNAYTSIWENVGGSGGTEFVVVQIGSTLRFFENSASPLSGQIVFTNSTGSTTPYTVDLATHAFDGSSDAKVRVASINGALVVVSEDINPFYIERDLADGTFTETTITFRVRDFEWQSDIADFDEAVASGSVTEARKYDTKNAGWSDGENDIGDNALTTYTTAETAWPPLTHPWFSGKDVDGNFSVTEFQEVYAGTSRVANGHYIYDLWDINRDTASGLSGLTTDTENTRFRAVTPYSGRVFYAGLNSKKNSGKIFFSQLIEDITQIGECLQLNDPTSEYLSDLLDTDGGHISIPEASDIKRIHVFGPRLLVFAGNGIWAISGVDDVFRATEFSISKISEIGLDNEGSFVSAGGRPYWWSFNGIHTITVTDQGGFQEQNISLDTVQTFWEGITPEQKGTVDATYDPVNNKVFWFYPQAGESVVGKLNKALILDEQLGAFYPWTVSDKSINSPHIIGCFNTKNVGSGTITANVVDSNYSRVVTSGGDQVVADVLGRTDAGSADVQVLVRDSSTGSITFGEFKGTDFYDWGTEDYTSFATAGFNFQGDMTTFKTTPYVTVYSKRTEEGWSGNAVDGYQPVRPSSLLVSGFVDFKSTASSAAQQAYRYKFPLVVDPADLDTFDYPHSVISTRLKIRGRGRNYNIKFESEAGKDFHLLGWEVIGAKNNAI